jgi:alkaline phosphatase
MPTTNRESQTTDALPLFNAPPVEPTRRAFLQQGALVLGGLTLGGLPRVAWAAAQEEAKPALRMGLITDCHYADRNQSGTRYYRESLTKLTEAIDKFNSLGLDIVAELGDLIDEAPDTAGEIGHLKKTEETYAKFKGDRHYVLGNHCVWTLTKEEFLDNCGMDKAHYSFDKGDFHFVVLDACYKQDGTPYAKKNYVYTDTFVPPAELEWLKANLAATMKKTIILAHQRLDYSQSDGRNNWNTTVKNAPDVRKILEESGKVLAVFQGHSHQNDYRQVSGIHYCVFRAMVEGSGEESNGYSVANLFADGSIKIEGFRQQRPYEWKKA